MFKPIIVTVKWRLMRLLALNIFNDRKLFASTFTSVTCVVKREAH